MIPFSFIIPVLDEADGINLAIDTLYRQFLDEEFEVIYPGYHTLQFRR